MNQQRIDYHYQVGGSLPPHAKCYVHRPADDALYEALSKGQFCYIFAARQMGKSSLRVRTMQRLQQDGIRCGVLDMTMMGTRHMSISQWYASIVRRLIRIYGLSTDFRSWWAARSELSPVQCLSEFLEDELLAQVKAPIVLFVDEIDATLQLDFSADDFFALIRAVYNYRSEKPDYCRLSFALIGVAIPSDLIANPRITPFNIGQSIVLEGFDWQGASSLLPGLQGRVQSPEALLRDILTWSGGQPFLTQKICRLIKKSVLATDSTTELNKDVKDGPTGKTYGLDVAELIQRQIVNNWEVQDRPEHLKTVRDGLLGNVEVVGRVLGLYQRLLANERVTTDESLAQVTLRLSGVVVDFQGQLKIANQIYRAVFNADWVARELAKLRPYAKPLRAWLTSDCQEGRYLLKGLTLQSALAWAETKRLSDVDYRFLAASQEAAKQAVEDDLAHEVGERTRAEFALRVATEATQLLAQTRREARAQVISLRNMGRWLAGVMLGVTGLVGAVRWAGGLQGLEWSLFDQFFRWRPAVTLDSRVVVVTIDEADIQTLGFPISDGQLAEALEEINSHQPRLIGLDIYRDFKVEPGHDRLVSVLENSPNIIGIEKFGGVAIAPPPALLASDRFGFADQIIDSDGTVRRALLSIETEQGESKFGFPLKLASLYLAQAGIEPEPLPQNPDMIRLGKTLLKPFGAYDGGYVRADAGGYQLLLNYTGTPDQFSTFSITQVLEQQISDEALRDRIVLMGSTASTVNDVLITPYTHRLDGYMSGVSVHANIVSLLLRGALEGDSLMRVWPKTIELVWIFGWIAAGTLIVGRCRRQPLLSAVLVTGAVIVLIGSAYGLFLVGWWVPVIPASLGMVMATLAVPVATSKQLERLILEKTTVDLARQTQRNPAVGKIAIAYLKQSESQKNQDWIDLTLEKSEN
ncbi:MAG: CHASE2 domain-containing protein [Cyanobacteria bacterium J06598_3]